MEKMKACGFPFFGKAARFFLGVGGLVVCGVSGGTDGGNELLDKPAGPGGWAGGRTDVCLRSGTGDWARGYLDFWEKFGFWERM